MIKSKGFLLSLALIITTISFYINEPLFAQSSRALGPVNLMENTYLSIQGTLRFEKLEVGNIRTAKTGANSFINFIEGSGWIDASKGQFIDGYVKVLHDESFVFPIGSEEQYRPIAITGGAMTNAAYFDKNPNKLRKRATSRAANTSVSTSDIVNISEAGYWAINGAKATSITLTWQGDDKVGELTDESLATLSIIGWKAGEWEVIPSSVDQYALDNTSSQVKSGKLLTDLLAGSITTTTAIVPDTYDYFTLGAVKTTEIAVGPISLNLYPNPSLTKLPLNIAYQLPNEGEGMVQIFSSTGVLMAERVLPSVKGVTTFPNLTNVAGTYTVRITDSQGELLTKKLVVASSGY